MSDPRQPSPYGPPQPVGPHPAAPTPQSPYGSPNPYGYAPPPPRMNTLAIVSLCASGSIVVLFMLMFIFPAIGLLPSLAGIVTGHIALSQIKRTGERGRGLAITGLALGYAVLGLLVLGLIAMIAFFGLLSATDGFS